jgi:hypothetical protein
MRFKYIGYNPYLSPDSCKGVFDDEWKRLYIPPECIPKSAFREGFYYVTVGKDRIYGYLFEDGIWYKYNKKISSIDTGYEFLMYRRELTDDEFSKLSSSREELDPFEMSRKDFYWGMVYRANHMKRYTRDSHKNLILYNLDKKNAASFYLNIKLR